MDGGAWWATVQGVTKSWTQLSDFTLCLLAKILSVLIYSLVIRGVFEGVNSFKYVIPRSQTENSFLLVCQWLSTSIDCL